MELNPDDDRLTYRVVLGRQVARHRKNAKLSIRELAAELRFPYGYIGRVERGEQLPSENLAKAMDTFFGVPALFADLLKAADDAAIPDYGRMLLRKEKKALRIQEMTSTVVPGLLQTEEYARELFRVGHLWDSEEQLDQWTAIRMRRQELFRREVPPQYWALLDEAVLARPVGGPRCMRGQLDHLLGMLENPNVVMQVLPFAAGAGSLTGGSATLLNLDDGTLIGHVEGMMVGEPVLSANRLIKLTRKFDMARCQALSIDESVHVMRRYREEYEVDERVVRSA
ncbi:helix-turn-helix domain-containing protein [Streptomyces marincola]|uniref:helix-turn-helix domain-containing protein n=1 Tax=Streptomyces marincola TaxID=2878388 RepID=UPI001CF2DC23|nr:helix-turn-helix transcriptional regulator [Streptomyces marincola]UCM90488.1 helix-turn-helix transcriptional regulator [Streptomyces marincola]